MTEREQEREEFQKEVEKLKAQLLNKEKQGDSQGRLQHEVGRPFWAVALNHKDGWAAQLDALRLCKGGVGGTAGCFETKGGVVAQLDALRLKVGWCHS